MAATTDGLKVGELARAAGLSIRTVRYYDRIGLLSPSGRSTVGHRLYGDADVRRLYRICLLRRAGLALAEIGRAFDDPGWDLHHAMLAHLDMLDQQVAVGQALRRRVSHMADALAGNGAPATAEFLETLEEMTTLDDAVHQRFPSSSTTTFPRSTPTAVMVEDVDAHHARAVEVGAQIVYPPTDQPYGFREYSARDPEGGLWSFMKPLD